MRVILNVRPRARGFAGASMLGALACALAPVRLSGFAIALALVGVFTAGVDLAPGTLSLIRRRRSLLAAVGIVAAVLAWLTVGVLRASHPLLNFVPVAPGSLLQVFTPANDGIQPVAWPWRAGGVPLLPLMVVVLSAVGGFVLISDAVRVAVGLARPPRSMWRAFSGGPSRGGRIAVRAIPGLGLIGILLFLGLSLFSHRISSDPVLATLGILGITAAATLLVIGPVVVGLGMRIDVDKVGRAREQERVRFASHLHDSVLQTLALIQRQATDADAVSRLARRQEHALRAWMAGESGVSGTTVAVAVRDMVAEVEDEHEITIDLTSIGDAPLDTRGEQLVAAGREALRNAARHAHGASVNVFLDVDRMRTEMFVRDDGPGFEFTLIPAERRGLRDSVIGRMTLAGGSALVESLPGEGTEVVLLLPHRSS